MWLFLVRGWRGREPPERGQIRALWDEPIFDVPIPLSAGRFNFETICEGYGEISHYRGRGRRAAMLLVALWGEPEPG